MEVLTRKVGHREVLSTPSNQNTQLHPLYQQQHSAFTLWAIWKTANKITFTNTAILCDCPAILGQMEADIESEKERLLFSPFKD